MKAVIDTDECTACGVCEETCPEVFKLGDDYAEVTVDEIPADAEASAKEAAEECPVECIRIEE